MTQVLKVEHLKAGYGSRVVLKDVSFGVDAGEIRVILGGSGCGKSTLLNNILQLERPLGGSISFFGQEYAATKLIPDEVRKRMGVLFQGEPCSQALRWRKTWRFHCVGTCPDFRRE